MVRNYDIFTIYEAKKVNKSKTYKYHLRIGSELNTKK